MKMSFICLIIKNHFHKKGFALGLVLKQRLAASRKWPIHESGGGFSIFHFLIYVFVYRVNRRK